MTDQGRINMYRLRANTLCQLYAIYRRELHTAIMDIKAIGDECRSLYIEIDAVRDAVADECVKQDLRDLLLHMRETRQVDKQNSYGATKNWVQEIVSELLDELRKLPPLPLVVSDTIPLHGKKGACA